MLDKILDSYNELLKQFNGDKVALNNYLERNEIAQYLIIVYADCAMYEHTFKSKKGTVLNKKEKELKRFIKELIKEGEINKGDVYTYTFRKLKDID